MYNPETSRAAGNQKQEPPAPNGETVYVSLTRAPLSVQAIMDRVRSPSAGAIVLFAGTTRNNTEGQTVSHLNYTAYAPLALRSLSAIAHSVLDEYGLERVAIVHRLGTVPISQDSILVAVSAPHRQTAWRAGEEVLERVKARAEIFKKEQFEDGKSEWRENRDGKGHAHDPGHEKRLPAESDCETLEARREWAAVQL